MRMKTNVFGLEVEITAKGLTEKRFNKEDTQAFLNYLSIVANEAHYRYEERGATALAKQADEFATSLYEILDADGYYDSCRL